MAPAGLRRPRASRAVLPAALVLLALLPACSLAGRAADPSPAPEEAQEAPWLDGSLDGAGEPAGLEELVLGEPVGGTERGAAGVASNGAPADEGAVARRPLTLDEEIRAQFGTLFLHPTTPVPPELTDQVAEYVQLFHAGRARANFERWLAREGRYRELILEQLRAEGLPEELLYLAMLESGFNPVAVSRAKAVGLWQFMRATGRQSGLRIDDWVDERRDPIASTRAAIGHLKVLHRELGDWALAAAAYNAGLGRVRRAQKGSGADYFQLASEGRLPRETRNYVPLILAAGHVARNRDRYGFDAVVPDPPHAYETVAVEGRTRLSAVAAVTGVPVAELGTLNAHLLRGAAPPGPSYDVRVPAGTPRTGLSERLAALPLEERILPEYREVFVTVRSGDSWWRIARAHGRTVQAVRALNPKLGEVIHPGQRILVERQIVTDAQLAASPATRRGTSSGSDTPLVAPVRTASTASTTSTTSTTSTPVPTPATKAERPAVAVSDGAYRVRPGDTMSELAEDLSVSVGELAAWNGMEKPRPLRAGETLRVVPPPPPPPTRHEVTAGETMTGIAKRYGIAVRQLAEWNGMSEPRPLRIGEVLVVRSSPDAGG